MKHQITVHDDVREALDKSMVVLREQRQAVDNAESYPDKCRRQERVIEAQGSLLYGLLRLFQSTDYDGDVAVFPMLMSSDGLSLEFRFDSGFSGGIVHQDVKDDGHHWGVHT